MTKNLDVLTGIVREVRIILKPYLSDEAELDAAVRAVMSAIMDAAIKRSACSREVIVERLPDEWRERAM